MTRLAIRILFTGLAAFGLAGCPDEIPNRPPKPKAVSLEPAAPAAAVGPGTFAAAARSAG